MFNRYSQKHKIIIFIVIGISFVFLITIPLWLMFFIGYYYCRKELTESLKTSVLEQEKPESEIDNSVDEIDL